MSGVTYNDPGQRRGTILGQVIKHALFVSTLEISGEVWKQPLHMGDTVIFRQVVPFGATAAAPDVFSTTAAANLIQEGNTPAADTLKMLDTTVQVQKYGCLYTYTERQANLGEDPMPDWMTEQVGERLGLVRELVYGAALQGCTNRFYAGGTTRATVDEVLTLNLLDKITRSLRGNHAQFVRKTMKSSQMYGTVSLAPAFLDFTHTDAQRDIEQIAGYAPVSDYGQQERVHEMELGKVGSHRFVVSPDIPKFINAATSGTLGNLKSTGGTYADVYQLFTIAKDAWGHTAFRGLDAVDFNHIPWNKKEKVDPTGERGYVSGTFYDAAVVTRHGQMAATDFAVTNL
ncbi:MAG: N4-gp56 family major capsid protein [Sterolibacterium sp.]